MYKDLILLGVNIDHIATLRQARGSLYPEPVHAALIAEKAGADGITAHLREDRRHIQDRDIVLLKDMIHSRLNMEMAVTDEMISIATKVKPAACCLVPEKRQELTTEGGLDIVKNFTRVKQACETLTEAGIEVSLFIDPDQQQIDASLKVGAPVVELHTGTYAEVKNKANQIQELKRIQDMAVYADENGLQVNAGHGLNRLNVEAIARIPQIKELNIGHAIISDAVIYGLEESVSQMKNIIRSART